jgi:CheY-like chemotaxis protein
VRPGVAAQAAARARSAVRPNGASALAENLFLDDDEPEEAAAVAPGAGRGGPFRERGGAWDAGLGGPGAPAGAEGPLAGPTAVGAPSKTAAGGPQAGVGPAAAGVAAAAPVPPGAEGPAAKRQGEGVILLVEDEAPVRAFASRALRMRGYTVIEAESAEEALATLEDPALEVDLFVTDVIMPGLDGPSWVRRALETRPNVKVVFVSGYAEDSFGEEQSRIPNSVFLPKPFSLSELTATVQDQIS